MSLFRRITIVTLPVLIQLFYKSDSLFIGCLLTGCVLNLFFYRIFPRISNCFSLSEMVLYLKWMLLLLFLVFQEATIVATRVSATIVILSVSLTAIVLSFYSFVPFVQSHPWVIYSFIVAGASIENWVSLLHNSGAVHLMVSSMDSSRSHPVLPSSAFGCLFIGQHV